MPKNILIFSDGTGQAGGLRPDQRLSNVYKLYRATRTGPDSAIDPAAQVAYYDPGLGTMTNAGTVRRSVWGAIKSVAGLAVGLGFNGNVIDCYEAILKSYEPGDRIYLFGFSRGGYTARAVANVLNLCGVPTTDGHGGPLPRAGRTLRAIATEAVVKVYGHGAGHARARFEPEREALARAFRAKYGAGQHPDRADVHPEFIGVFDAVAALGLNGPERVGVLVAGAVAVAAVASATGIAAEWALGWPWERVAAAVLAGAGALAALAYGRATFRFSPRTIRTQSLPFHFALWRGKHFDGYLDRRIPRARHALAIDETRTKFHRVAWGDGGASNDKDPTTGKARFEQLWFAGNHSDVGGSYPEEESRLSDIALQWMVDEALTHRNPILLDPSKLHLFPSPKGIQHCERFAFAQAHQWLAALKIGWSGSPRPIRPDATLHQSVIERFQLPVVQQCDRHAAYRPDALRHHDAVKHFYAPALDAAIPRPSNPEAGGVA